MRASRSHRCWRPSWPASFCRTELPQDSIPLNGIAWGCAALISFFAFATSLILASMSPEAAKEADAAEHVMNGKPVFDPDAYDVVSSRA